VTTENNDAPPEVVGEPYTLTKEVLVCFHQRPVLSEIYRLSVIKKTEYLEDDSENMKLTIKTNKKNYRRIEKLLGCTRG